MTEVYFNRLDDGWWAIEFEYDREVVALLKTVPVAHRNYISRHRVWEVSPDHTASVVQRLTEMGCDVYGVRLARADELPQESEAPDVTWADAVFDRVGRDQPALIDDVFKALSKVFYSRPGESEALQAELNAARARLTPRNVS